MTKYIYRGKQAFSAGHFRLRPLEIVDGTHPALAFGVPDLVLVAEEAADISEPEDVEVTEGSGSFEGDGDLGVNISTTA